MKICIKKSNIINVVKVQLLDLELYRNIILALSIFTIVCVIMTRDLVEKSNLCKFEINFWDIVFRIVTYPFFIILAYVPIMLIITAIFHNKNNYMYSIYLRINNKRNWIITNILSVSLINFIVTTLLFVLIGILGIIYSHYSSEWSTTTLKISPEMKIYTYLYPNSFIKELSPIKASFIAYIQILLGVNIICCIRDMLTEYLTKIKTANIIISIFIFINFILMTFPSIKNLTHKVEYISLHNIMIIWYHKFNNSVSFGKLTLSETLSSSLLLLILLLSIRIVLSKKMVIRNDE